MYGKKISVNTIANHGIEWKQPKNFKYEDKNTVKLKLINKYLRTRSNLYIITTSLTCNSAYVKIRFGKFNSKGAPYIISSEYKDCRT